MTIIIHTEEEKRAAEERYQRIIAKRHEYLTANGWAELPGGSPYVHPALYGRWSQEQATILQLWKDGKDTDAKRLSDNYTECLDGMLGL